MTDAQTTTDEQIKHMVSRFLAWKLPENFNPDAGISFERDYNQNTPWPMKHEPSGTNLFDATQAEAMVRHMIDGLSALEPSTGGADHIADAGKMVAPEGYKLVPVEPTVGMFNALASAFADSETGRLAMAQWSLGRFREDYQAMLAASPSIELKAGGTDGWIEWKGGECPVDPSALRSIQSQEGGAT